MSASEGPLEVVISYAHRDQALKDELIVHLSPLRRQGIIADWHDRDIDAGDDWKREIDIRLNAAGMILLLISPDFIASDYCYEIEMERALARHDTGNCRVIPIFLRACDWKGAPFGRLQGLPDDAIPLVSAQWPCRDDAFLRVSKGIRRVAEKWRKQRATAAGRAEKNSVPRRNRSLEDGTIERSPHPVAPLEDLEAAQISALDDTEGSFRLRLEPILS